MYSCDNNIINIPKYKDVDWVEMEGEEWMIHLRFNKSKSNEYLRLLIEPSSRGLLKAICVICKLADMTKKSMIYKA